MRQALNQSTILNSTFFVSGIVIYFIIGVSCNRNNTEPSATPEIQEAPSPPVVQNADVIARPSFNISVSELALGECMSLALLVDRLKDPMFEYPSALMTTEFKFLDKEISNNKAKFLAYSSFFLRLAPANENMPFSKAIQSDCKSLQLLSASGVNLKYIISEFSDRHLKFSLTKDFEVVIPEYQKDAYFKRFQASEIEIVAISETELKIEKKISVFDPLCRKKKNRINVQVSELFTWAKNEIELPLNYNVEKNFLELVLSSLQTPPWIDPDNPLPVPLIKEIMLAPVADDIKLCD